jgi:hypothetical protein
MSAVLTGCRGGSGQSAPTITIGKSGCLIQHLAVIAQLVVGAAADDPFAPAGFDLNEVNEVNEALAEPA